LKLRVNVDHNCVCVKVTNTTKKTLICFISKKKIIHIKHFKDDPTLVPVSINLTILQKKQTIQPEVETLQETQLIENKQQKS